MIPPHEAALSDLPGRVFEHRHVEHWSVICIREARLPYRAQHPAELGGIAHGDTSQLDQDDQNSGFLCGKLQTTTGRQVDGPNSFEQNSTECLTAGTLQSCTQSIGMSAQSCDDEAARSKRERRQSWTARITGLNHGGSLAYPEQTRMAPQLSKPLRGNGQADANCRGRGSGARNNLAQDDARARIYTGYS
jgi:hypothetical protein